MSLDPIIITPEMNRTICATFQAAGRGMGDEGGGRRTKKRFYPMLCNIHKRPAEKLKQQSWFLQREIQGWFPPHSISPWTIALIQYLFLYFASHIQRQTYRCFSFCKADWEVPAQEDRSLLQTSRLGKGRERKWFQLNTNDSYWIVFYTLHLSWRVIGQSCSPGLH